MSCCGRELPGATVQWLEVLDLGCRGPDINNHSSGVWFQTRVGIDESEGNYSTMIDQWACLLSFDHYHHKQHSTH